MHSVAALRAALASVVLGAGVACGSDSTSPGDPGTHVSAACPGIDFGPAPARLTLPASTPAAMTVLGNGLDTARYTSELSVRGSLAYTTSWSFRRASGNKVTVWDVSGNVPIALDSVFVTSAGTTGDVAVSDDGTLLVVATEFTGGSIAIYSLADPRHPTLLSRYNGSETNVGVHTAELGRVNGRLYAFLAVDASGGTPGRLVTIDLNDPSKPGDVFLRTIATSFIHDTYQRDGLLFEALWDNGLEIWDLGGCKTGATPEAPKFLSSIKTLGGEVHNVWWYHDQSGSKRYAFVGQEGPGTVASKSSGDIHVVDLTDLAAPKEVAVYSVPGAGTHNFSVDETNGVLYAAYYNGGVRAIDVRGDLGTCDANQKVLDQASNLSRCDLRLMGRELAVGLNDLNKPVYVWGVQYLNGNVYASDMLNGIWKLRAAK